MSERTNYSEEEKARFFQIAMLPYCAMKAAAYWTLLQDLNNPKMASLIQEVPGDVLLPSLSLPLEEQREIFYSKKGNIEEIIRGAANLKPEEGGSAEASPEENAQTPEAEASHPEEAVSEVPAESVEQLEQTPSVEMTESVIEEEMPQQEDVPNRIPSLEPMEHPDTGSEELKGMIFNPDQTFPEFGPFYNNSEIPPFNRKDVITGSK